MNIDYSSRGAGKTTRLILLAAQTGKTILCINAEEAHRISWLAEKMNVGPVNVVTLDELLSDKLVGRNIRHVLIDNGDLLLECLVAQRLHGATVDEITVTSQHLDNHERLETLKSALAIIEQYERRDMEKGWESWTSNYALAMDAIRAALAAAGKGEGA